MILREPFTIAAFIVVAVLILAGGIALSVGLKCDPTVQQCIDYGSGTVEAPK